MAEFEGKLNLNVNTSEIEVNGKFELTEDELDAVAGGQDPTQNPTGSLSLDFMNGLNREKAQMGPCDNSADPMGLNALQPTAAPGSDGKDQSPDPLTCAYGAEN